MINKYLKEYTEKEFNKQENYNKILSRSKGDGEMKMTIKKITSLVAVFILVLFIGVTSKTIYAKVKWNIEFKDFQNRPQIESKGRIEQAREDGYAEVLDMDYVTQDGIGVKVDSIMLTDDCFMANLSFKFDENIKVDAQNFLYNCVVYDENNNIYGVCERVETDNLKMKYLPFVYKELGVKYDKRNVHAIELGDQIGIGIMKVNEKNKSLESSMEVRSNKANFPKSKKLYIRIENLGFTMVDVENRKIVNTEDFQISNSKWIFEIDVPEKFYQRETYNLELKEEIPGLEVTRINLTELGLTMNFKSKDYYDLIMKGKDMNSEEFKEKRNNMLYLTDERENKYQDLDCGTAEGEKEFKMRIDASKKDLESKIYLNYNVDGKEYKTELIKNK